MRHTRHGYWIEEAGEQPRLPALQGAREADVLVIGGGYTGLWTAWHVLGLEPAARVAVLEAEAFGAGPSGRNGGFVNAMWFSLPTLCRRHGERRGLEVALAAAASVKAIGAFCEAEEVDAWFTPRGYLQVSAAPAQDRTVRAALDGLALHPAAGVELSPAEVAERCRSPRFRGGAFYPDAATVQPARLAAGLRERVGGRGAFLAEGSRVLRLRAEGAGVVAETGSGSVRARAAVLACGGTLAGAGSPVRNNLTVTSSHMAITEPVPDVLAEAGWTGGECITDSRAMIHYMRTTPDRRIAFGWGGGRISYGGRLQGRTEIDPEVVARVATDLRSFFPALRGRRIEHAWGGPIDVAPSHLPLITQVGPRVFAAFGYTGHGVGPSQMVGRTLASLALDRRDGPTRLAIVEPKPGRVPPEPLRFIGGNLIRQALLRKEDAEEAGRTPPLLSRAVAKVPELIGFHIGR